MRYKLYKPYGRSLSAWCVLLPLSVLLVAHFQLKAQQQGVFTQYMFNMLAINPAYAGYSGGGEALDIKLLARQQWVGLDGAPSTQMLSAHSPIRKTNMGVGMQLSHDMVGSTRDVSADLFYAYHIPVMGRRRFTGRRFTGASSLSLGLQAGVSYFSNERSRLFTNARQQGEDPAFFANDVSAALFNIGVGAYYYTDNFYVGVSLPRILENKKSRGSPQLRHIFFTSGALFYLGHSLTLKPSVLLRIVPGAPLQLDVNANLLIKKMVWLGISWRSFASVNFIVEYNITHRLRLGYAYDLITTDMNKITNNTHELMLNYKVALGEIKILNPRCF